MSKGILGVIVAIVIMAAMFFSSYNGLVSMNENVTGKWSQVENQLQRRNDLIPNLKIPSKAMQHTKQRYSRLCPMPALSLAVPKP